MQSGEVSVGLSVMQSFWRVGFVEVADVGEEVGDAVGGGAEPGDEVGFEGVGEGGDLLDGFDEVGRQAGVVEGVVAVGALGDEVGKNWLHVLGDEAGVRGSCRRFSFPVVGDGIEFQHGREAVGAVERHDIGLEAAIG